MSQTKTLAQCYYYQLRCVTCNEDFLPFLSTQPGEMLYPSGESECKRCSAHANVGEYCSSCGMWCSSTAFDSVTEFIHKHRIKGHQLEEMKVTGDCYGDAEPVESATIVSK